MLKIHFEEFEFYAAVVMNVAIFWDIAQCSPYTYGLIGAASQKMAILLHF
jgi:hypothetical protein